MRKQVQHKAWSLSNSTKTKYVDNNKQKLGNSLLAHYFYCIVLSSAEKKKCGVNKVKIQT